MPLWWDQSTLDDISAWKAERQTMGANCLTLRVGLRTATTKSIFLSHNGSSPSIPQAYLKSPKLIEQWAKENNDKRRKLWTELYKVNDAGNPELINRFDWTMPPSQGLTFKHLKRELQWYVNSTSTVLYDLAYKVFGQALWQKRRHSDSFITACIEIVFQGRPGNSILNWALSILMMGWAFWHTWPRRNNLCKLILWVTFVGVFNLAGLLTYLALNHTTIIKCTACGK